MRLLSCVLVFAVVTTIVIFVTVLRYVGHLFRYVGVFSLTSSHIIHPFFLPGSQFPNVN